MTLFDLSKDISERNNLAASNPAERDALDKKRIAWDAELIEPVFEGLIMKKADKRKGK